MDTARSVDASGLPVAAIQVISPHPQGYEALFDQAWGLLREGRLDQVQQTLHEIGREAPDGNESVLGRRLELAGLVYHAQGRPLEAADAIENASLRVPISFETQIALASCYAQLRRTQLARELFFELVLRRELSPLLTLRVAAELDAIDSPDLALQTCQWLIDQGETITQTHTAQAHYDMGYYAARAGHPLYLTEACIHLAMAMDPENADYRAGLISIQAKMPCDDETTQPEVKS